MKNLSTLLLLALSGAAKAQLEYYSEPTTQWDGKIQSIRTGNGLFLTPDETSLIASSSKGIIYSLNAIDGTLEWSFTPTSPTGTPEFVSSSSGVTFSESTVPYLVYTVILNDATENPETRVIAVNLNNGTQIWASENLAGINSGNLAASSTGLYVFLNHNSNAETVGHFTVLDATDGSVFYTEENSQAPLGHIGIHHTPDEGYYAGGEFNQNDVLVWSVQPKPTDTSVGDGATFAFQFPIGFQQGSAENLAVTPLGSKNRDFQATSKPVFADDGRTLYWGTTRSQFSCWLGERGATRYFFSNPRTAGVGFSRGTPAMQAIFAPLVMTHDESLEGRQLFGGSAAKEFVRLNGDFSEQEVISTTGLVKTQAHVSPDDQYVYYVEFDGFLHQASTDDLMDAWVHDLVVPIEGESALRSDGSMFYVGDVSGKIHALRIADVPTEAPSSSPTKVPTMSPSNSPSGLDDTDAPTSIAAAPTSAPTKAPVDVEGVVEEIDNKEESAAAYPTGWKAIASAGLAALTWVLV